MQPPVQSTSTQPARSSLLAAAPTGSGLGAGTGAKIRGRAARDDSSSSPGYGSPTREPPMKKRPSIIGLRSSSGLGTSALGQPKPALRSAGLLGQRPPFQKSATLSAASAAEFHALSRPSAVHFGSLPLPSETGSHDRLQRLSPETMIQLLNGGFDEVVSNYTIIDCRYTYEYAGGHIPGAVNLRTVEEIKDYLLTPRSGLHLDSDILPPRTTAGRVGAGDKHVLIFHCEYSQKRAPRMAAALRDIDRSLAQDWPRCHYPELYILQGGYERFYKQYPAICQPRQYVGEKDPRYEMEWKAESRTFNREFTRHKSMPVPRKLQRRMSESAAGMMLQPGMGPRAATASYVPMLCSAGSAMIREASREGDHSFSP
ncbi:hypothetical protein V8E36_000723 [Tilletia maclaganii]